MLGYGLVFLVVQTQPSDRFHSPHRTSKNVVAESTIDYVFDQLDEFDQESPTPRAFTGSAEPRNGNLVKNDPALKSYFAADLQSSQHASHQGHMQTSDQDTVDPTDASNGSLVKDDFTLKRVHANDSDSAQYESELGRMSGSTRRSTFEPKSRLRVRRQLPFSSLHMDGGDSIISNDSALILHGARGDYPDENLNGHSRNPGITFDNDLPIDTLSLISASEAARKPTQQLQENAESNGNVWAVSASSAPVSWDAPNIGQVASTSTSTPLWTGFWESGSCHQEPSMQGSYARPSRWSTNLLRFGTRTSATAGSLQRQIRGPSVDGCDVSNAGFTRNSFCWENDRARDGERRVEEFSDRFNEHTREGQVDPRIASTRRTSSAGNEEYVAISSVEPRRRHQKLRERLARLKAQLGAESRPWESSPRSQLAAEVRRLEAELESKIRSRDPS